MRNLHAILVLATILLPISAVQAAPADLPKTGQTTCTDTAGSIIACANTGHDGDLQAGVAWPNPRFSVDSTGNCLTDNLTGLMWVRNPDVATRTWQQSLDFANGLVLCGSADWRLPNVNELESLLNSEVANQTGFLSSQGFSRVQASSYWSSTIYAGFGSASFPSAWVISMGIGSMGPVDKSASHFVLPVRAGQ